MGGSSNQALLDLENSTKSSSSKESALLVCKRDDDDEDLLKKIETAKIKANSPPDSKPIIAPPPPSQVMGKLEDFLGVMAESNKKLQIDSMNSNKYDIEALTGDESEYIEMDLMLGVTDLHTPEAVAAAESAIVGCQPVISLDGSSTESELESESESDDGNGEPNKITCSPMKSNSENGKKRKRPKIVELS